MYERIHVCMRMGVDFLLKKMTEFRLSDEELHSFGRSL